MNAAHLHITLVHIPIVIVPLALILFLYGFRKAERILISLSLTLFVVAALFTGGGYLLGEEAEEKVEHLAGVEEDTIEDHEDGALWALWLTVSLGVVSLGGLIALQRNEKILSALAIPITLLGILSTGSLAVTGQLGGKIRHPEAFDRAQKPKASVP